MKAMSLAFAAFCALASIRDMLLQHDGQAALGAGLCSLMILFAGTIGAGK